MITLRRSFDKEVKENNKHDKDDSLVLVDLLNKKGIFKILFPGEIWVDEMTKILEKYEKQDWKHAWLIKLIIELQYRMLEIEFRDPSKEINVGLKYTDFPRTESLLHRLNFPEEMVHAWVESISGETLLNICEYAHDLNICEIIFAYYNEEDTPWDQIDRLVNEFGFEKAIEEDIPWDQINQLVEEL